MANYQNLKTAISAAIKTNGNQEITGQVLQNVLNSIVSVIGANYTFAGVATPSTNPGTPDQNVVYMASQAGTYTNFNAVVLPAGISLLMWNGTWTSETVMYGDGGVFDISVYKSTGGTLATFADLAAALDGGNNIPVGVRKGGMSVKFVQSSDNKYVQYRLAASNWSNDIHDWTSEDPYFIDKIIQEVNEAIDENTPIEIHGDVTNAPDEEDLTSVNVDGTDVLKFKDKAYNQLTYSGLGRKYLRKNIVDGVNTLTQSMINQANTIYVIQYDFTLGADITVPANCVLEFDGGSISGAYTITGNNTKISSNAKISKNISYDGSFACGIDLYWVYDLTSITQSYLDNIISVFKEVKFADKTYTSETGLLIRGINDVKLIGRPNSEIKYIGDIQDLPTIQGSATIWVVNCNNFKIRNIKLSQDKPWMARPLPSDDNIQDYRTMRLYRFPNLILSNVNDFEIVGVESSYCQANFILQSSTNGLFDNCYVHHSLADGFLFDGATNITVTNCRGYKIDDDFLSSAATYINETLRKSYNLTYSDNIVTDSFGSVICAEGTEDVTFINCIGINMRYNPIKLGNASHSGMQIPGNRQTVVNFTATITEDAELSPLISGTGDVKSENINLSNVCIKSPNDTIRLPFVGQNVNICNCTFDNINLFANISNNINICNCCFNSAMYLYLFNSSNITVKDCNFVNNRYGDTDPYPIRVANCENVYLSFTANKPIAYLTNGDNNVHIYGQAWAVIRESDDINSFKNVHTEISRAGSLSSTITPLSMYKNGEVTQILSGFLNIINGKVTNNIIGNESELTAINSYTNAGTTAYKSDEETPVWFNGGVWKYADKAHIGIKRNGTFEQKPHSSKIYVGFQYFCTDKQTTEGATNGIMIYHKGSNVWVDALGRVVS